MRMSTLIGRTVREVPSEAETESHKLLLRTGMIHKIASGIYVYGPLVWRSMNKIMHILREEMNAVDGQEINMPVTAPADLWIETGRWNSVGSELVRWKDRGGRDMVLSMTHEETITDFVRSQISSYKQLPFMLYQIQTKFRDEPRSRGGLIRVREFTMKDGYSFHLTDEDMDAYYERVAHAYYRIFNRAGIDVVSVQSDNGMFGGKESHEYMYITPVGEDKLIFCDHCRYAANHEVARRQLVEEQQDAMGDLQDVATPDLLDIPGQAAFLGREPKHFLKTLAYMCRDELVLVALRGDLSLNEVKLKRVLGEENIHMATAEELQRYQLNAGFLSPIGRTERLIVDESVPRSRNLIAGANREGFHVDNANFGRDYSTAEIHDLVAIMDNDPCPVCGQPLREARGIETGNIFKLGRRYSEKMNALVQDENGNLQTMLMGCYGIGVGRMVSCAIEEHHDEAGIIWPISIAPMPFHLTTLGVDEHVVQLAEELYRTWSAAGMEVLYDDRDLRPGVKLNDADLLGMPIRVVISKRSLANNELEIKQRGAESAFTIPVEGASQYLQNMLAALLEEMHAQYPHLQV